MCVLNILFLLICATGIQGSQRCMCDLDDVNCTTLSSAKYYYEEMTGKEGLWESSDPLKLKLIEGGSSTLSFKFFSVVLTGLLQCTLTYLKMDTKTEIMDYEIDCPRLTEAAHYQIKGCIGDEYVEGEGRSKVTRDQYNWIIHLKYDRYKAEDGYDHIRIMSYKPSFESNGKVNYEYEELFNGDKEKSDAVNAYMNRNSKTMEETIGNTVMSRFVDKYMKNMNDELKVVPLKDLMFYEV